MGPTYQHLLPVCTRAKLLILAGHLDKELAPQDRHRVLGTARMTEDPSEQEPCLGSHGPWRMDRVLFPEGPLEQVTIFMLRLIGPVEWCPA